MAHGDILQDLKETRAIVARAIARCSGMLLKDDDPGVRAVRAALQEQHARIGVLIAPEEA